VDTLDAHKLIIADLPW